MVVDMCKEVVIQCPKCGKFKDYSLNLLDFLADGCKTFQCECGDLNLKLETMMDKKMVFLEIHCSHCSKLHFYKLGLDSIIHKNNNLSCLDGKSLCFIGNNLKNKNNLMRKNYSASNLLELAMKKIYTLYESGRINCQCDTPKIIMEVFHDRIELKCESCGGSNIIYSKDQEDMMELFTVSNIELKSSIYSI